MKKIIKILFVFILSMVVYNAVNAASVTISPTQKTIAPGEIVNISAGVVDAAGWDIEVTTSGGTLSGTVKDADSSGTQTTKTILTPTFTASAEGKYTVTVKGELTYDDSSSDLGISKTTVSATATITVKAPEQKPAEEPKEEPKEEKPVEQPKEETPAKSSNNRLANLGIKPNDFKNFKPGTTTYYITVPYSVSEVEVYAEKQESSQKISGTGKVRLKEGKNTVRVVCTAEDGTTKTYTMYITREAEEEEKTQETEKTVDETTNEEQKTEEKTDDNQEQTEDKVLGITKLNITAKTEKEETVAVELNPAFNENTYEYMIAVPLTVKDLEITAETANGKAELEVMGNKNLVEGENIVTVIAKVGEETKIYQITVTKTAQVTASALSNEIIIQLAIIAAIATIIIVAIATIIIMLVKSRKKDKVKGKKSTIDIDIGEMPNEIADNEEDKK